MRTILEIWHHPLKCLLLLEVGNIYIGIQVGAATTDIDKMNFNVVFAVFFAESVSAFTAFQWGMKKYAFEMTLEQVYFFIYSLYKYN